MVHRDGWTELESALLENGALRRAKRVKTGQRASLKYKPEKESTAIRKEGKKTATAARRY